MPAIMFPPKPLKDIKPWGINTPTQTQEWLLAVQRIAAASITVFLFVRYQTDLRLPPIQLRVLTLAAGYCLSTPATFIGLGAFKLYNGTINLMNLNSKNMTFIVGNALTITGAYLMVNAYQLKVPSPNFLDKVFNTIAGRYCGPVYDRFFCR
jgi:hypothetical protein